MQRRLPLTHMILGLLLDGPAHGYELRRCLAPFLGTTGLPNAGLLYPALARLERRGFVLKQRVTQRGAPDRQVYAATAAGARELTDWLRHREGDDRAPRYDFFHRDPLLARVMFFRHLEPARQRELLHAELAHAVARIDDYRDVRDAMRRRGADRFRIRILDLGLGYHELRAAWIRQLLGARPRRIPAHRADARRTR